MARWEADARGRLERAALGLFAERGYERTTVAEIAQRAGLQERSFYRHYPDKREVLFGGGEDLMHHLVDALKGVPADLTALDALTSALATAESVFRAKDYVRERDAVIAANPALYERELIKLASLSASLSAALMRRGVEVRTAQLATDMGMSIFRLAFGRWIADGDSDFATFIHETTEQLREVAANTAHVKALATRLGDSTTST